jgi:DNA-directed RNA polymerase specialized sigma24 family protein
MIPTITYSAPTVIVIHAQAAPAIVRMEGERGLPSTTDLAADFVVAHCSDAACEISDSQALYLHNLARRTARRLGLDQNLAEDCAGQFVLLMLAPPHTGQLRAAFAQGSVGWLFRCAENWGLNYLRQIRALRTREVSWSVLQPNAEGDNGEDAPVGEPVTNEGNPEAELLRSELMARILAAADMLRKGQRSLFFRSLAGGTHPVALALATDHRRSPGAVRNARWRLRQRLRRLLAEAGLTAEEARSYLEFLQRY